MVAAIWSVVHGLQSTRQELQQEPHHRPEYKNAEKRCQWPGHAMLDMEPEEDEHRHRGDSPVREVEDPRSPVTQYEPCRS